jgi:hypothetical protein
MRLDSTSGAPMVVASRLLYRDRLLFGGTPSLDSECIRSNQTQAIRTLFPCDTAAGLTSNLMRAGTAFRPVQSQRAGPQTGNSAARKMQI